MENIIKSEELERLQKELEEAQQKGLKERIYHCEKSIKFYNLCESFKPIKSTIQDYINEIGYVAADDQFYYTFRHHNDISFFAFLFQHYTGKDFDYRDFMGYPLEEAYSTLKGYIFYDSEGNILLEKKKTYGGHSNVKDSGRIIGPKHCGVDLEYIPTFIDDEYMYIQTDNPKKRETKLYKLKDNHYEFICNFEDKSITVNPSLWAQNLLVIGRDKIYNVKENKYVFISNGHIGLSDDENLSLPFTKELFGEEAYEEQKNNIINYLKENNFMLVTNSFEATFKEHKNYYSTMYFIDTKGNIVSKLYVISKQDGKCQEYKVTNKNYGDIINKLQMAATKKLEKIVIKEEAAKKLREEKEKQEKLLNMVAFYNMINKACEEKNPTLNLNPNNKN